MHLETKWEIFQILWPSQKTLSLTNLLGYFLTNHPCRSRYLSTNLLSRKSATMQIEKPYTSSFASQILGASSEILGNASASHFTSGVVWNLLFFSNAWMNNFSIFNFVWFDERRIRSSFWGHHTQATRNVIVAYVVLIWNYLFSISCYQNIDRHYLFAFYL